MPLSPPTRGLKFWYRSDDVVLDGSNNVEQWNDRSGNGTHSVQATPSARATAPDVGDGSPGGGVIPGVRIAGGKSYPLPIGVQSSLELWAVWKPNSLKHPWNIGAFPDASWWNFSGTIYESGMSDWFRFVAPTAPYVGYHFAREGPGTTCLMRGLVNTAGETFNDLGAVVEGADGVHTTLWDSPPTYSYLGFPFGEGGNVRLWDLLCFDAVLSTEERWAVENYFYDRYGIGTFRAITLYADPAAVGAHFAVGRANVDADPFRALQGHGSAMPRLAATGGALPALDAAGASRAALRAIARAYPLPE